MLMYVLALVAVVCLVLLVVSTLRGRRARALAGTLQTRVDHQEEELRHLVGTQLPALRQAMFQGQQTVVPAPLHHDLTGTRFRAAQESLLLSFQEVLTEAGERAEQAARASVVTVVRGMQPLLSDVTRSIDDMLRHHHAPEVLADATAIDHTSNQLTRRVQVIRVLAGSWPGRQREPAPVLDVVRGGVSKIRDYDRVEITGEPAYQVISQAVEPVVLALAELLDNATKHSEPGASVLVGFVRSHNGVTITIDDAGTGLKPEEAEAAPQKLSGTDLPRFTQMGSRPQYGFRAVGLLAARYGFRVSVSEASIYGGVRAALFLPSALLKPAQATGRVGAKAAPAAIPAPRAETPATPPLVPRPVRRSKDAAPGQDRTAEAPPAVRQDGLPQRVNRRSSRKGTPASSAVTPPRGTGRALGGFQRGMRRAQAEGSTSGERTSEQ